MRIIVDLSTSNVGDAPSSKARGASPRRVSKTKIIINVMMSLVLIVGVGVLFYPTFADIYHAYKSANAIAEYEESVADSNADENAVQLSDAELYNQQLFEQGDGLIENTNFLQQLADAKAYNESLGEGYLDTTLTGEGYAELEKYESLIDPLGNSMMGYMIIPEIDVELPIYHGCSDASLEVGVGHMIGSSLPVGGPSTHAVMAAHSGLPSAKMFDDAEYLSDGDIIIISVLGQKIGYAVDSMVKILPEDAEPFKIEKGRDQITLITCTPRGVNTYRLLIGAHRVDLPPEVLDQMAEETGFDIRVLALCVLCAIIALIILVVVVLLRRHRKLRRQMRTEKPNCVRES